ncbi:MAG TPA: PPC domain-containing protein [Pirellulales bacterium]|nr:PPC domain-containing protein [Pirellulales bacterium]
MRGNKGLHSHRAASCFGAALLLGITFFTHMAYAAPPQWKYLFPAGAQVGTTVELEARGKFEQWPLAVWADRPGVTISAKEDKGKFVATVAGNALPGVHWLRFYDAEGATPLVPFVVGYLREACEQEPNDAPTRPQDVGPPQVVVNGRLQKRGDVDTFAVHLEKGQTLVAEIDAHRTLASPVDTVLEMVSTTGGFVLARNDDDQELDSRLVFAVPRSGSYMVRVFGFPAAPNSTIALAGDDSYAYRLTLTSAGFLNYSLPLAVSADTAHVQAHGWNLLPETQQVAPAILPNAKEAALFHPQLANTLLIPVVQHASILADEPSRPEIPQNITLPVTITGRIEFPRDKDSFRFSAKTGETLNFRVESRQLGYPLDPVLEIRDSQGKLLSRVDDVGAGRDAEITFAAPADGEYQIVVSDLHRHGAPNFVYRLSALAARPDYALSLGGDTFSVAVGQRLELPITIERLQGYKEPINLRVEGLPGGVTVEPAVSLGEGDSAKTVKLVITTGDAAFSGPIRVIGTTAGATLEPHTATAPLIGRGQRTPDAWLTITAAASK